MDGVSALDQSLVTSNATFGQIDQLRLAAGRVSAEKQAAVAKDFESVFASMLIKQMRESLTEGMFGSDSGDVYGGMFDLFIGKHMAQSQPLGIDRMVKSYLQRLDSAPPPTANVRS